MKFKCMLKRFVLLLCLFMSTLYILKCIAVPNNITNNFSSESPDNEDDDGTDNFESSKYSLIILVQVHNRAEYLRELIYSLSKVSGISSALLIFSHDLIDEEINNLVRNVTFCEVLQIYFPYSIEKFPDQFPGDDPNDCPRDIPKTDAVNRNCNSAQFPDKYNHYRESKICQIKHHWWWKANYVIDSLEAAQNHTGLFLFLEEDLYVLPDLINVTKKMDIACRKQPKTCAGLVMGNNAKGNCPNNILRVVLQSKMGSIGFAIYKKTWDLIKNCSRDFCTFDEYNWDYSILYVMKTCLKDEVALLFSDCSPRVLHLGVCGVHTISKNCDVAFNNLRNVYRGMVNNLNPNEVVVVDRVRPGNRPGGSGGWADPRDHELCMSMVNNDDVG